MLAYVTIGFDNKSDLEFPDEIIRVSEMLSKLVEMCLARLF